MGWKCSSLLVSKVGSAGLTGSRKISGLASDIIYLEEIKKIRKNINKKECKVLLSSAAVTS